MTKYPPSPVLLVDDEAQFLFGCEHALYSAGINNVVTFESSAEVMPYLAAHDVSVVILDLNIPSISGEELLVKIKESYYEIPVIILTGTMEIDTAVQCMKAGAHDYILKPVEKNHFIAAVKNVIDTAETRRENLSLKERFLSGNLENPDAFSNIITCNTAMGAIFQYIESIARINRPALIQGETGVGKELIAEAIHRVSGREGKFVAVNVAGIDDSVFSDTLFGHVKGAFTGADSARKGFIEEATGGTLFLDEVGDLSMASQVKLLRLTQQKEYFPVGSDMPKSSDARIIVATNQDIKSLSEKGAFRRDLYYRLNNHQITIPPLRARKEDIPHLVAEFVSEAAKTLNKKIPAIPDELLALLDSYDFPGNVRELQGMVFDAMTKHKDGALSVKSFSEKIIGKSEDIAGTSSRPTTSPQASSGGIGLLLTPEGKFPTLKEADAFLIEEALKISGGKQAMAAQLLGITRQALGSRLSRYKENTK